MPFIPWTTFIWHLNGRCTRSNHSVNVFARWFFLVKFSKFIIFADLFQSLLSSWWSFTGAVVSKREKLQLDEDENYFSFKQALWRKNTILKILKYSINSVKNFFHKTASILLISSDLNCNFRFERITKSSGKYQRRLEKFQNT